MSKPIDGTALVFLTASSLLLLIGPLAGDTGRAAEGAEDVLRKYSSTISNLRTIRFDATKQVYERGGPYDSWTWVDSDEIVFVSIDGRWRCRLRQRSNQWYGGKIYPSALDVEYARNEHGDLYEVRRQHQPEKPLVEGEALNLRITDSVAPTVIVTFENNSRRGNGHLQDIIRPILGYLPGDNDNWLPDLMRESGVQIADQPEEVDGHRTLVLRSHGKFGAHAVYVDPEAGYLPRMITVSKEGQDRTGPNEEPMESQKSRNDPNHRKPNAALRRSVLEIKNIAIAKDDNGLYIDKYNSVETLTYNNHQVFEQKEIVSLKNVSLRPKTQDLVLTEPIPNGTRVHIKNAPAIDCEWKDGQIVKRLDQTAIDGLSDVTFRAGGASRLRKGWLVILNMALLALVVFCVFAYRRLKHRRGVASK